MNDGFLCQFREQPRREFAEALYKKISREKGRISTLPHFKILTLRQVMWSLGVLCLVCAVIFMVSPEVRAQVGEIIRSIGGLTFAETDWHPDPSNQRRVIILPTVQFAEAQEKLGFTLLIPTWVPEGFALKDEVQVLPPDFVILEWQNADGEVIRLFADRSSSSGALVGPGGLEEIEINGKSTALLRGGTHPESGAWILTPDLTLMWWRPEDGVTYSLVSVDGVVSLADLVHMVETIR